MTPGLRDRPRRLRRTPSLRALVRETRLHPKMLVAPIFIRSGRGVREQIGSLPGVDRVSVDEALRDAERYAELGLGGVILFGLPEAKDAQGSGAWIEDGVVQSAERGRAPHVDIPSRSLALKALRLSCGKRCRRTRSAR